MTESGDGMRTQTLDSYIRVSRKGGRGGESYITVDEQRRTNAAVAKAKNVKLGIEVVEEDVSGNKKHTERDLEDLIRRVERKESDGILCATQDRLSRGSMLEQASIWERLDKAGARFIAGDGVDSAQPGQELLFTIKAAIAREQWKGARDNFKRSTRNAIERGVYVAGRIAFGYGKHPKGHERAKRLFVIPEQARWVHEAFLRKASGCGYSELARWLNAEGVPTSTGGEWVRETVKYMLTNPVYLGHVRQGKLVNESAHEAIVTQAEFDEAQTAKLTRKPVKDSVASEAQLGGLLVCAGCGHNLMVAPSGPDRERYPFYYCRGNYADGKCTDRGSGRASAVDKFVEDFILDALKPHGVLAEAVASSERLDQAARDMDDAKHAVKRFLNNAKLAAAMDEDEYTTLFETLKDAERLSMADYYDAKSASETIGAFEGDMFKRWPTMSAMEKRAFFMGCLDRVELRSGNRKRNAPVGPRVRIIGVGNVVLHPNHEVSAKVGMVSDPTLASRTEEIQR